jgi:hypothetical protein
MKQNLNSGADWRSSGHVPRNLWNTRMYSRVHNKPRSLLREINPVKVLTSYLFNIHFNIVLPSSLDSRSRWPRGLRRRSAAAWLLRSRARIPLGAWMFVSCLYAVLPCVGRGLCDGLITRPQESCCVSNSVWFVLWCLWRWWWWWRWLW